MPAWNPENEAKSGVRNGTTVYVRDQETKMGPNSDGWRLAAGRSEIFVPVALDLIELFFSFAY